MGVLNQFRVKTPSFWGFKVVVSDGESKKDRISHPMEDEDKKKSIFTDIIKDSIKDSIEIAEDEVTYDFSKIQQKLFCSVIKPEIFIRHSSNDKDLAFKIAEALKDKGLTTFLDYICWDSIYKLEKDLIKNHVKSKRNCYCGVERSLVKTKLLKKIIRCTTTILTRSLNCVMSQSSSVLFLDTDNFLSSSDSKTESPWIYAEIEQYKLLMDFHKKESLIQESEDSSQSMESLKIKFQAPLKDCPSIELKTLLNFITSTNDKISIRYLHTQINKPEFRHDRE